jgi:hypothetical protein
MRRDDASMRNLSAGSSIAARGRRGAHTEPHGTTMSETEKPNVSGDQSGSERRRNARLRELVDEMLASIRESQRRDDWTPEERARAEADLERIMAQVRRAAVDQNR